VPDQRIRDLLKPLTLTLSPFEGEGTRGIVPTIAYIALGSNLGDRAANIAAAVEQLRGTEGIEAVRLSSLLENPSVGGPSDAPDYLNAVAEVRTTLPATELLDRLLDIEHELGRVR